MFDNRPTYDIAASHIAAYVQPLWHGALANPFEIRDEFGRMLNLHEDHLSGKHMILVFLNTDDQQKNVAILKSFAEKQSVYDDSNTTLLAITSSSDANKNKQLIEQSGFNWPVAGDATGAVFAAYGLHKSYGEAARIVLLTPYRQVRIWFDSPSNIEHTLEVITQMIDTYSSADDQKWSPCHAPVLHIPNVLSPEECAKVIESFESGGPFFVRPPRPGEVSGNFKVPVYEHNRQDRVDHIVKDKAMLEFLDSRIFGQITPMISKAFAFNVTRKEDLHIARYTGERGGHHMGHRDNTMPATAYRRFAMSLTLNNNYAGGELTFNEFSPHGYKPETGSAMIFSSSLLHEVSEITEGTRYNLVSNLFNDESLGKR